MVIVRPLISYLYFELDWTCDSDGRMYSLRKRCVGLDIKPSHVPGRRYREMTLRTPWGYNKIWAKDCSARCSSIRLTRWLHKIYLIKSMFT